MLGLHFTDTEPFHTVYLHGIVRDPYGQKMSKTKGNVVDPLEMIRDIGADALRVALVSGQRARRGPAPDRVEADRRPELHEQALECRSLRARRPAGGRCGAAVEPSLRHPLDPFAPGRRRPSAPRGSSTRSTWPATRRPSTRSRGATTATGSSRWPRSTSVGADATDADRAATWRRPRRGAGDDPVASSIRSCRS